MMQVLGGPRKKHSAGRSLPTPGLHNPCIEKMANTVMCKSVRPVKTFFMIFSAVHQILSYV